MGKREKTPSVKHRLGGFLKRAAKRLKDIGKMAAEALYPEGLVCLDCGGELKDGERRHSLCEKCAEKLPYRDGKICERCACYIDDGRLCKACMTSETYFDGVAAPFDYNGIIRKIIIEYKDGGATFYYKYIARHLADYFSATDEKADIICYVPSDKKAIRRRGFEHNKKVSEFIGQETSLPVYYPLERIKAVRDQTKSNRAERAKNVKDAFAVKKGFDAKSLQDKRIILIDDIVTTGATANECARVLKEAGVKSVTVLALARR